jgi:hypothetical protein
MNVTKAEQFIGAYGQSYRAGVLIDHTDRFVEAGGTIRVGRHAVWALVPKMAAIPVVCGEIVEIATEDGPISGRCGCNVAKDLGACAGHANERDEWLAMSEAERCAWERNRDEMGY